VTLGVLLQKEYKGSENYGRIVEVMEWEVMQGMNALVFLMLERLQV